MKNLVVVAIGGNSLIRDKEHQTVQDQKNQIKKTCLNIAEGFGRYSTADRMNFYYYARGSFEETKAWLRKAVRRSLIEESKLDKYKIIIDELGPKLNAFIEKTKTFKSKLQK